MKPHLVLHVNRVGTDGIANFQDAYEDRMADVIAEQTGRIHELEQENIALRSMVKRAQPVEKSITPWWQLVVVWAMLAQGGFMVGWVIWELEKSVLRYLNLIQW